jgi:hypothetical protein
MANHMSLLAQQAAQTPASVWPVLGGDFNTGQDDPLAARLLESMTVVAGSGIDLIWVGKHETYKSSEPTTVPRLSPWRYLTHPRQTCHSRHPRLSSWFALHQFPWSFLQAGKARCR